MLHKLYRCTQRRRGEATLRQNGRVAGGMTGATAASVLAAVVRARSRLRGPSHPRAAAAQLLCCAVVG
jgi:hypothetical protein